MKKSKILALLLCLTVMFTFTSCGEKTLAEENQTEIKKEQLADKDNKNYGELTKQTQDVLQFDSDKTAVTEVGETMANDFFDWTVNSYETKKETHGQSAGKGYKYVIINLSMKNTEDYEYETGNYEFRGVISGQAEDLDSENAFYDGMFPDVAVISPGETLEGDVLFKVPENCTSFLINFMETYGDGSEGNLYCYEMKL